MARHFDPGWGEEVPMRARVAMMTQNYLECPHRNHDDGNTDDDSMNDDDNNSLFDHIDDLAGEYCFHDVGNRSLDKAVLQLKLLNECFNESNDYPSYNTRELNELCETIENMYNDIDNQELDTILHHMQNLYDNFIIIHELIINTPVPGFNPDDSTDTGSGDDTIDDDNDTDDNDNDTEDNNNDTIDNDNGRIYTTI